jgi:pyruvate dehydrogenase E1 component alpha subunit
MLPFDWKLLYRKNHEIGNWFCANLSQERPEGVLQVISEQGERIESLEPKISESDLKRIYRSMVQTRIFDTKALGWQRQGRIGFFVPSTGQEAAQVGSAFALNERDWLLPTYRDMAILMLRQVPIWRLISHLMGNKEDPSIGRQMPSHWGFKEINFVSIASTIGAHLPVAVGIAMGMKMKKQETVVMAYHGDGGTSAGEFHTAYNFAGVFKAPIVFICENNGWAISLPSSRQTASHTFSEKARAYGFDGIRVDGNDVLAVYSASKEAVDRARRGEGPTMIECLTYRMGPHSTSDDPTKYRSKEETEDWRKKDPIERFRTYLEGRGYWTKDYEDSLRSEIEIEINEALKQQSNVSKPEINTMFEDVYSSMPWNLKEQLAEEMSLEETNE